jgi:hypothetical protein
MRSVFVNGGCAAIVLLFCGSAAMAQSTAAAPPPAPAPAPAATSADAATRQQNLAEDIKLLRKDVRSQKSKAMGTAMHLDADQAAKFWPIYKEYDAQLAKLNDVRLGNIMAYAKAYENMTDNKADELVNGAIAYHRKRIDLLASYYDKFKAALGAPIAARFVQVESTLLNLIDLQIQSNLPLIWGPAKEAKP